MSMRVGINIEERSVLHACLNFLRTLSCFPLWSLMQSFPLRSLLQTRRAYPLLPSAIVTIRLIVNGRQQRELRKQKTRRRNPMNQNMLIQLPISTWGLNAIFLPFFIFSFRNRRAYFIENISETLQSAIFWNRQLQLPQHNIFLLSITREWPRIPLKNSKKAMVTWIASFFKKRTLT